MDERTLPTLNMVEPPVEGENALRLVVLGSVYAAAVFFAVAFSPAIGFVSPHPVGETGRLAQVQTHAPTTVPR